MAGTMPHAIFVETGLDGGATVAAYAAELPGCAAFGASDDAAVRAMPDRVRAFTAWLRRQGEEAPEFVGDNWYEVERAAAGPEGRAAFTLDDLPPSDAEWQRWLGWLELGREELADAIDAAPAEAVAGEPAIAALLAQDASFVRAIGAEARELPDDPVDRLYAVRDVLTDALAAVGPGGEGVRRILRLAIADDLRLAERLRGGAA